MTPPDLEELAARVESGQAEAWIEMIYQSVRFASWAGGQGICPADGEPATAPDEFLMAFSTAIDFEDWESLPERTRALLAAALRAMKEEGR